MPYFVIAGRADCALYVHAIRIANFLNEHLPDVIVNKREFLQGAWEEFLLDLNRANGWFVKSSPVIWKEVAYAGSRPHLIGGLSEFWEYVDDYYGVSTFLDRKTIEKLREQNLKAHNEKKSKNSHERNETFVVGIFGFNNEYSQMLLQELFSVPHFFQSKPVTIKILDPESLRDIDVEEEILTILNDYRNCIMTKVLYELIFSINLTDFVENTDLIMITEDFSQHDTEGREVWLRRCGAEMFDLSNEINEKGKRNLRLICCHLGPVCLTATSLTKHCSNHYANNIVAVTAHEGLKALSSVSKFTEIQTANFGAPPVWGFVGLDQFIDIQSIIVLQEIVRPYRRAIRNIEGSTLPQKRIIRELRYLSCTVDRKNMENDLIQRCNKYRKLNKQCALPLMRATLHLLELWYSPKKNTEKIISLGVYSSGAFGIPHNIVFSQPVSLNDEKLWKPYDKLPILESSRGELQKCLKFTENLIDLIWDYF